MDEQPDGSNRASLEQILITHTSQKHLRRFVLTIGVLAGCFLLH
ncbi:hypothetical protein QS257_17055 [Terrilactibacillus sp. S3-3]|nr:hypothetical protein QS257_17055 [Terrilactibacillus sp. S3-3]